ncbi:MAG: right-handed parallel beta-helix repeat-containing protein [Methanosarcinales archaeon]|jgi:hypothetical protein|nr:right-handed parallel beta-helix repeat-containing protein [Methanosarcinales archaeon]
MKTIAKALILSVLILLLFTSAATAQEWVVTSGGDTANRVDLSSVNLSNMTLREAIAKASSGDTIVFADNVAAVIVTNGTLNISKDLTIGGPSNVSVARNSSQVTREMTVFTVSGANVTFRQLTIENGSTANGTGGGVLIDRANVTFESCTIQRNRADTGGGVYVANNSNVKFVSSTLFRNNATTDGSAIFIRSGSVELQNTVIDGHSGRHNLVRLEQGRLIADRTTIATNTMTVRGSPVSAASGTTVEFRNSTFSNNTATESAGILTRGTLIVENCVFDRGTTSGNGGGISLMNGSTGTIKYSIFSNADVAGDGGGIFVDAGATAAIDTCTFLNNIANYGGAFFSRGTVNATAVTAINNTAKFFGGAVALWNGGDLTMTKSVLAANTARSNNTPRETGGGGMNISNSRATLSNNVVVGNTDPRNIDFGEQNATVRSGGNNLIGAYNGSGRFPIEATDQSGIQAADVFVINGGLPDVNRATGYTAGFDRVPVYTVALNSSPNNPAAIVLGVVTQPPAPGPGDNETNQTPPPPPTDPEYNDHGNWIKYLIYGIAAIVLLVIIAVAAFLLWRYNEKRKYKFG